MWTSQTLPWRYVVRQRGDAGGVNWCWLRETQKAAKRRQEAQKIWVSRSREVGRGSRAVGLLRRREETREEQALLGRTVTNTATIEIAVEPWIDTGHQGHVVSWNDMGDMFMKPPMQLWKWFLVPFKFPGILLIHSHSQMCFDDTFASCNLKGPGKPRDSSPSFSLFPFLPNAITNSCHLCPQIPSFCTFLLMEEALILSAQMLWTGRAGFKNSEI